MTPTSGDGERLDRRLLGFSEGAAEAAGRFFVEAAGIAMELLG
jgi:hypothetical protein